MSHTPHKLLSKGNGEGNTEEWGKNNGSLSRMSLQRPLLDASRTRNDVEKLGSGLGILS